MSKIVILFALLGCLTIGGTEAASKKCPGGVTNPSYKVLNGKHKIVAYKDDRYYIYKDIEANGGYIYEGKVKSEKDCQKWCSSEGSRPKDAPEKECYGYTFKKMNQGDHCWLWSYGVDLKNQAGEIDGLLGWNKKGGGFSSGWRSPKHCPEKFKDFKKP